MEKQIMNLLRNKKVLYLVLFFAICEVVLLASNKKYNTLVFFVVLGVLSSYFTKNMTIVLLIPLVVTYFLARGNVIKEGMIPKVNDPVPPAIHRYCRG